MRRVRGEGSSVRGTIGVVGRGGAERGQRDGSPRARPAGARAERKHERAADKHLQ
jgi:hypothetical protein